jgi:hypothetical protein
LSSLAFTIGHSTRSFGQFAGLLRGNGVEHLVDVRRFPHSRRHPHFDAESLPEGLRVGAGIGYTHLPGLGGRRQTEPDSPNTGWGNPSFRGYADHMRTPEFRENLQKLLELCERERVYLMCSEAVWWRCHRRMVSDALVERDVTVEHILGEGRRQTHQITPFARVVGGVELAYPPTPERLPRFGQSTNYTNGAGRGDLVCADKLTARRVCSPGATGSVKATARERRYGRRQQRMCCTQRDQSLEEEARRLRVEEESRRRHGEEASREKDLEKKPAMEKAKEKVGAK